MDRFTALAETLLGLLRAICIVRCQMWDGGVQTVKRRAVGVINDCNIIQQSRSQQEEECEGLRPILLLLSRDPDGVMLVRTSNSSVACRIGICTPILF